MQVKILYIFKKTIQLKYTSSCSYIVRHLVLFFCCWQLSVLHSPDTSNQKGYFQSKKSCGISKMLRNTTFLIMVSYYEIITCTVIFLIISHATSCERNNVFDQSVSLVFVSATPLKTRHRILWNYVVIKDTMCRCT